MLQRRKRDVVEIVEWRVVMNRPPDVGEADASEANTFEDGEVGVVRQKLVDVVVKRARGRPRQRCCDRASDPFVLPAGLEEETRSVRSARLDVDDSRAVA